MDLECNFLENEGSGGELSVGVLARLWIFYVDMPVLNELVEDVCAHFFNEYNK